MSFRYLLLGAILGLSLSAVAAPGQHAKSHKPKAKTVEAAPTPAPAPAPVQPPPQPPTPEQGPSTPPEVSFQSGQLTIVARNSSMGDVLNAVRQKTGAAVEMPATSSERVVGRFGPGAPRDVMAQLLNGSHFDYVLLGSPADPGALKKVVLMARASGPQPVEPENPGSPGLQAVPNVETDQSVQESNTEMPPEIQQPEQEEPQAEQPPEQPPPGGAGVKTPEQLLRELQQQQQQQQNAPSPQ